MELPSESSKSSICNGQNQLSYQSDEFVNQLFDEFCSANTFKNISKLFEDLCHTTGINSERSNLIYNLLKLNIKSWKAQNVWSKLDKKMAGWEYADGTACNNTKVIVIGCGPCGLRVAIEAALLGCKVIVVEKRDGFTRNNVLHLWPFLIHDLKSLGAKHFFGRFCSGSIDHISIRTLQCILLKVALLLGVEVHSGVEFVALREPQDCKEGWKAELIPNDHVVSQFAFDVCISADGKRNTMPEFKRKEFRGKLAIAITANFINHKTKAEASVEEISGVSYIFNQKFFKDLSQETGIDLENIVYYKDETHYFVMTAKKHNLLIKKVLLQDFDDPEMLLSSINVDQEALMSYAIQAAEFSTNYKLPKLEFAHNHYGRPDVSMFDFTSMFAAENACRVVERCDTKLLLGLVGDTLLEPFWPTGSGCARGFLGALDAAWMIRSWSLRKMSVLHIIAERESIYQLLSQTTSENLHKNYVGYSTDPSTRYVNLNLQSIYPEQVRHLFDGTNMERSVDAGQNVKTNIKYKQYDMCEKYKLMRWCQMQLESYDKLVRVVDMYSSWKNGIALSALIHRYRPDIIDVYSLDSRMALQNVQKAMVILEKEFGVVSEFDAEDILTSGVQVENILTSYLMQFREIVSTTQLSSASKLQDAPKDSLLESKISLNGSEKSKVTEKTTEEKDGYIKSLFAGKNNFSSFADKTVSVIAQNLSMKLEGKNSENISPASSVCHACKCRVYLVQRLMAEGLIFHRNCFRCSYCSTCLHKDYYAYCKIADEDKFFCKHHYGLSRPSPSESEFKVKDTNIGHAKSKHHAAKKSKISERAEYTTESEMGENEDDQTRHNLIDVGSTHKSETELSTSEEELQFLVDEPSDEEPDFAWAQVAKLYSTQSNEKVHSDSIKFSSRNFDLLKVRTTSIVSLDSTSEVGTVGGSDADWETDTEIESEQNVETVKNDKTATATVSLKDGPMLQREISVRSSIRSSAISNNRMAFFSAPTQPVRIDARTFLGLDKDEKSDEAVVEESSQVIEKDEDEVSDGNDELLATKLEQVEDVHPKIVIKSKVKRLKLKSKKFTKKRRKDEKRKTRNGTFTLSRNKSMNEEDSSAENNEKHVSPACTIVKKMKRDGTTESDESKVDHNLLPRDQVSSVVAHTDVIEMLASQLQHPPCLENNIVQLSSDSEMSQDDDQPTLNEENLLNTKESFSSEEIVLSVLSKKADDEVEESSGSGNNIRDDNTSSLQYDEHSGIPSDDLLVEDENLKSRESSLEDEEADLIASSSSLVNTEETNRKDEVAESCQVSNDAGKELNAILRFPHRSTSFDGCLKLSAAIDSLLKDNLCSEDENELKNYTSSVNDAKICNDSVKDNSCMNKVSVSNTVIVEDKIQDDQKSLGTKSNWSLTSNIAVSKFLMSPGKFTDAKRRFFCEPPQPVRIDHRTLFGDLSYNNRDSLRSDTSSTLSRQTADTTSSDNKTVGGKSNRRDSILLSDQTQITNESKDSTARVEHNICASNETTVHSDQVLRVGEFISQHSEQTKVLELTELPGLTFSPFDSAEIIKDLKNILSDKPSFSAIKENYFSDPETSCKVGSSSKDLIESFQKKEKIFSGGKDKRKSFLSKIIQIKHDKKEKNGSSSISQAAKQHLSKHSEPFPASTKNIIKEKTNSLPLEKKKVCKKKMFESKVAFKSRSQGSKCEGIGGQSVYEEMAPIMEGIKKVEQRNREKNNIKERVHVIAPPLSKPHLTNLVPPKADLDDFETESELGEERLSIWSLHSQLQNISEEESSKQRKKQLRLIRRKHKEKEMARMQVVQEVMRKLEEIEIQQQQVEERGVQIERILRGERTEQERLLDEVFLIQEWFNAIQEKNFLNRYESELIVQTRELELEDKQCQLQLQLQETMFQDEVTDRTREQEHEILQELVDVVEKRDKLVLLLEEERLKHKQYDRNLQKIMEERGFLLNTGLAVSQENTFS